jgi:hypothetical protein
MRQPSPCAFFPSSREATQPEVAPSELCSGVAVLACSPRVPWDGKQQGVTKGKGQNVTAAPVHILLHSYKSGWSSCLPWAAVFPNPKISLETGGIAQVIEHLPSMHKTLGSIPNIAPKKQQQQQKKQTSLKKV